MCLGLPCGFAAFRVSALRLSRVSGLGLSRVYRLGLHLAFFGFW